MPENSLAKFGMTYLALKGRMFADGLLATSILLMNCTLDDMRHNRKRGGLVRIMERTSEVPRLETEEETAKPARSMLDVTVRKSPNDMFGKELTRLLITVYEGSLGFT